MARVLRGFDVTEAAVRRILPAAAAARPRDGLSLRIEQSASPAYQQIVDQVREAVALGRVGPDYRLPTVRQLAADLGLAPGTVARAYQELEQLGTVDTDGSRGTRIAPAPGTELPPRERTARLLALLRPVAVEAAHIGASPDEVLDAVHRTLELVYRSAPQPGRAYD